MLRPKKLLGAVYRQMFDGIYVLAAFIIAFTGVTFSILISEEGALGFQDGAAGIVLRGDKVNDFLLPFSLTFDGAVNLRSGLRNS